MPEEDMTAADIFKAITTQAVSMEIGIKLIENYGIRQVQKELVTLQEKYGGYTDEIEKSINRISGRLDEMLNTITGVKGKT
jgi:hypothetical protein